MPCPGEENSSSCNTLASMNLHCIAIGKHKLAHLSLGILAPCSCTAHSMGLSVKKPVMLACKTCVCVYSFRNKPHVK